MGTGQKPIERFPLFEIRARREHPASSHAECRRLNDKLTPSMEYALIYIRQYPGRSARDLELLAGCPPGKIWKVLAQLERRGQIKRIREGTKPMKIYPVKL